MPFKVVAAAAEAKICTMCAFALSHTLTIVSASRDVLKRMSQSEIARSAQSEKRKQLDLRSVNIMYTDDERECVVCACWAHRLFKSVNLTQCLLFAEIIHLPIWSSHK